MTFGGSGLDRAAELRGLADLPGGECIVLWRGKPAVIEETGALARIPRGHAIAEYCPEPLLLGRDENGTILEALDLSGWEPDGVDAAALTG
ncbi:MAG: NADH pyrophosphatase, partial [Pseudomonadota bacterium]